MHVRIVCMFVCIWQAVKFKPAGVKSSGFKRVGQQGDSPNTPSPKRRDGKGSEGRQGKGEVGDGWLEQCVYPCVQCIQLYAKRRGWSENDVYK